ncbi:hypothetical protein PsorP6_009740 [Peronosclerospora sorghi]|uniref:Uncharacterized protein n=1 Tax=Peronosclerospora sorghi TaxID=230839 RepID=A0ACC0W0H8_9STRA|nr:hypothetical protein PsorP6_009740 [Peronosclerospora sorghi]
MAYGISMALTKYVTFQCMVASSVNAAYRTKSLVFGDIQLHDGGTFQQLKKLGATLASNNATGYTECAGARAVRGHDACSGGHTGYFRDPSTQQGCTSW